MTNFKNEPQWAQDLIEQVESRYVMFRKRAAAISKSVERYANTRNYLTRHIATRYDTMTASVSATELAKLGKCASLIKSVSKDPVAVRTVRPVKQSQACRHTTKTPRGVSGHI